MWQISRDGNWSSLFLPSYITPTQGWHSPQRAGCTHVKPQLSIEKVSHGLAHRPAWWERFLSWGFLFPKWLHLLPSWHKSEKHGGLQLPNGSLNHRVRNGLANLSAYQSLEKKILEWRLHSFMDHLQGDWTPLSRITALYYPKKQPVSTDSDIGSWHY